MTRIVAASMALLLGAVAAWLLLRTGSPAPAAQRARSSPLEEPPGDEERGAARSGVPSPPSPIAAPGASAATAQPPPAEQAGAVPPRPRIEIVDPPEDARELADRAAHVAAEAYRNTVAALKLDAEQEARFKELLFDSRASYEAAMDIARRQLDDQHLEGARRAAAEAEARRRAFEDQRIAADESIRDLLDERQQAAFRSLVQNPLFLANALRFRVAEADAPPR